MKSASPSMTACVVVLVSCLAWIGALSLALFHILDLTPVTGWIVAGSLGFSAVAAVTAILFEMRHAVDLEEYADTFEFDAIPFPATWRGQASTPAAPRIPAPTFQTRH